MYNNLLYAMKQRILDEVVLAFNRHPAYSSKTKVHHKFPYEKRFQYGVVLRNSSGSQIRMSADNYLADLKSHVRLVRVDKSPGLAVEWVRENFNRVTNEITEDVSHLVGPTQRMFLTQHQMMAGFGDTSYATNIGQVRITKNGEELRPEFVDGKNKTVMLSSAPGPADVIKITYYKRTIADPAIYVLDFIADYEFTVSPVFIIEEELVLEKVSGTETSANLAHGDVYPTSDSLYLLSKKGGDPVFLDRGTDYTIDYTTGVISFLTPLAANFDLLADYRWQDTSYTNGPHSFRSYQELHDVIPGVVISIGRRSQKGDRQGIIISQNREQQAKIYGGHWDMSLSLGVVSKDPKQMEEMADHIINTLWGEKKNILEREGITINSVEPTGESEESYIDTTGDLYYESSVDISVMTEWQQFIPYFYNIKRINVSLEYLANLGLKNYFVDESNKLFFRELSPDMRKVLRYGTTSYERVI